MRVYLPLTLPALAALSSAGEVGPAPLTAYAVTPALREWYQSDSDEELEYAALGLAAEAALRLLAAESGAGASARRVVLAADVAPADVSPMDAASTAGSDGSGAPGEVRINAPVRLREAAAIHVDSAEAGPDVAAAVSALAGGDRMEEGASVMLERVAEHELLWYGVQELDTLI